MNLRPDGRSENTLRPLSCQLGTLQNCDGSSIWKSGHTAVLAAVHGPIAPRQVQYESASGCIVSVVIKWGGSTSNGTYDPEWESFLTQQLSACIVTESYPRSVISVVLQIINADGSVLAAALHAAVSALMDAAIDMKYLPTAVTCYCTSVAKAQPTRSPAVSTIQLDPTMDEEQSAQAVLVLVFLPKGNNDLLLGCYTTASMRLSGTRLLGCCSVASRAVSAIQAFWRLAIEKVTIDSCNIQASS
jgi:exosome complex component RRP46